MTESGHGCRCGGADDCGTMGRTARSCTMIVTSANAFTGVIQTG